MTESTNRPGLNVGDRRILDAINLPTEAAILEKLTELRDAGVSLDISELPTSSLEDIFYRITVGNLFEVLNFLLDANPLNAANRPVFRYILNFSPVGFSAILPLLHRAIRFKKVSTIQKLIQYGADVNKVHTAGGQMIKPLDIAAETTIEIYQILKNAGATSENKVYFAQNAHYDIFKLQFADVDIGNKIFYALLSKNNVLLDPLIRENDITLKDELLYRFFSFAQGGVRTLDGSAIVATPSEKVMTELWNIYKTKHPFDATFVYREPMRVMFSQRGLTCVSDAMFTVLLESPDLAPLWSGIDWSAMAGASVATANEAVTKYAGMFQAAKIRHNRLAGRAFTRGPIRRQQSVENTVWTGMYTPLSCPTGGILHSETTAFLTDLFNNNKLGLPALHTRPFSVINIHAANASSSALIDPSKITAVLLRTDDVLGKHAHGHMFAFFKNAAGAWVLVDNEVGFLHTVQDTDWFTGTFLPRLGPTVQTPDLTDSDKKVMFYMRNLLEFDLASQIITMGDKFYPNIDVPPVFLDLPNVYIPKEVIYILKDQPVNPYGVLLPPGTSSLGPYAMMYAAAAPANYNPYAPGPYPAAPVANNPYGIMLPGAPAYVPYAAPAVNTNSLQRRLQALREGISAPTPAASASNLRSRLEALSKETKVGGSRHKTRHLRSMRSKRSKHKRRKTFSRRK